jgi:flagellar basal-body rod protein FlgG
MSVQSLYTAATGMDSLQTKLDVIANNLANINTTGFKRDRANFEDLFYRREKLPGMQDNAGQITAVGIEIGMGSAVQSVQTDHGQGAFQATSRQLDIAIEGQGFLPVLDGASGQLMYTRAGNLSINANGQLVVGSALVGRLVDPAVTIPPDATDIVFSADGRVNVRQPGNQQLSQVGQLQLANFVNPQGLLKVGENMYVQTDASGNATPGNPGLNGLGIIRQNALESSNVEPVNELIDLITTQRAFELNSQAIQAGDQILQLVGNLRRF